MAFFKKKNNAKSTITAQLNIGATSITVFDETVFPTSGDFILTIWDSSLYPDPGDDPDMEIVKVTNVSTNTFTIVRAQENTSDVLHADGSDIQLLITAGQLDEITTALTNKLDTVSVSSPLSGSGTVGSPIVLDTSGTWSGNSATVTGLSVTAGKTLTIQKSMTLTAAD
ncbi:MAG: hypothetical protein WC860_07095, partial [Candidatus Margulisiibacteriota bacterium]